MKKILLILLTLTTFSATAQRQLSLNECIEDGLERNYGVRIARNEQRIAEGNATRAAAGQIPTLDLGVTLGGQNLRYPSSSTDPVNDFYVDLGATLGWTIFDGNVLVGYSRLKELAAQGELSLRATLEDFVAEVSAEYYTLIRQQERLANLETLVALSKERLRIVEQSFGLGASSGLDYQQAQVDYNADNSALLAQAELVKREMIELNRIIGGTLTDDIITADTAIVPDAILFYEDIWNAAQENNVGLLMSRSGGRLSELELKEINSRNYPYLKFTATYGYRYGTGTNYAAYNNRLGLTYGLTAGWTLFDGGNRRREQRNARLEVENSRLQYEQTEQQLESDFASLWLSYTNNLTLMYLEQDNLLVARKNYEISMERYRLRDISGLELREAQLALLQAEERLSTAEYNIKLCEISLRQISGTIL